MNLCTCGQELTVIGGTILECLTCFSRNMVEHNVSSLILLASLGVMREPITRGGIVR
jgi:hypothetical protein